MNPLTFFPTPRVLFFDFDGVLVDSVPLKTEAYQTIFAPYGKIAMQRISDFHLAHGGVDRYTKIRHVLTELRLCDSSDMKNEVEKLAGEFANKVKDAVIAAKSIRTGQHILDWARSSEIACHLISGTPEDELSEIVLKRNLAHFFLSIHGSPRSKSEILQDLIQKYEYDPAQCCMIGDAQTDFAAAQTTGIWFFGFPPNAATLAPDFGLFKL